MPHEQHPLDPQPIADRPRRRMPVALWPIIALGAACAVGAGVGALAFAAVDSQHAEGFEALGAILLAMALALLCAVVTFVAGIGLTAARAFPRGKRAAPACVALVVPGVIAGAAALTGSLTPVPVWQGAYVAAFLAALAAPSLAFAWVGTRQGWVRLGSFVAAALLVVTVGGVASTVSAGADASATAKRLPLVLFDGRSVDEPFSGWQRDRFSVNRVTSGAEPFAGQQQAYLKYFTPQGVVFVTMHSGAGACGPSAGYTCTVVGRNPAGELRRYDRIDGFGSYPTGPRIDALVYPDGRVVSVQGATRAPREVLDHLVRVPQKSFETATAAPLRTR